MSFFYDFLIRHTILGNRVIVTKKKLKFVNKCTVLDSFAAMVTLKLLLPLHRYFPPHLPFPLLMWSVWNSSWVVGIIRLSPPPPLVSRVPSWCTPVTPLWFREGGGGLPLLLPLLGENPPKMGFGHFGSMAKMDFNRLNMGVLLWNDGLVMSWLKFLDSLRKKLFFLESVNIEKIFLFSMKVVPNKYENLSRLWKMFSCTTTGWLLHGKLLPLMTFGLTGGQRIIFDTHATRANRLESWLSNSWIGSDFTSWNGFKPTNSAVPHVDNKNEKRT